MRALGALCGDVHIKNLVNRLELKLVAEVRFEEWT